MNGCSIIFAGILNFVLDGRNLFCFLLASWCKHYVCTQTIMLLWLNYSLPGLWAAILIWLHTTGMLSPFCVWLGDHEGTSSVPGRTLSLGSLQHSARGTRETNELFHSIERIPLVGFTLNCGSVIFHQLQVPGWAMLTSMGDARQPFSPFLYTFPLQVWSTTSGMARSVSYKERALMEGYQQWRPWGHAGASSFDWYWAIPGHEILHQPRHF